MKDADRIRLLVVDSVDTCSRFSDRVLLDASDGIQELMEELLLNAEEKEVEDLIASALVLVMAILKPLSEQMLAQTSDRHRRGRSKIESVTIPKDDYENEDFSDLFDDDLDGLNLG